MELHTLIIRWTRFQAFMWLCLLVAVAKLLPTQLQAQGRLVEARVSSISGGTASLLNGRGVFTLKPRDALLPGDQIDTRGGGRVVIELTDGSIVIVQPGSRVQLKDFRSASSLRELFEITFGWVRVKINHFGGRPNPYRVNSPTASIAVRGTDFSVSVIASETRVIVYEGLVEVTNLTNPQQQALVEPGRGVIVRPNEEIRFFIPGPGSEIGDRIERQGANGQAANGHNSAAIANGANPGDLLRNLAGEYERYIDSIVEPGERPLLARFLAFPEPHLDSLENPAYATSFSSFEGRLLLLPSFRGARSVVATRSLPEVNLPGSFDYGLLYQSSVFFPLLEKRLVLGGSFAGTRSNIQSFTQAQVDLTPLPSPVKIMGLRTTDTSTDNRSYSGSLIVARRFGSAGRTSLGLGLDHFSGHGSFSGRTSLTSGLGRNLGGVGLGGVNAREELEARSEVERTRLRFGLTRELAAGHKLGIFYYRGISSASDRDRRHTFNGLPLSLDSVSYGSRLSEIGLRLRGRLTRRWFYGMEGSWLGGSVNEAIRRAVIVESHEREHIQRLVVGGGLGYMPGPRMVLSLDLAGGLSHLSGSLYEDATGHLLEGKRQHTRFVSLHTGVQTDLWRQLFASASVLTLRQTRLTDEKLYPDRFGRRLNSHGLFVPDGRTRASFTEQVADLGLGWRFKPGFILHYIYSTDFGRTPSSHVLLLRYTFKRGDK